ncbi:MAG: ThuA domain-containing protein [Planctomycetaceae bacterium]|nr:ThuA domain-containing protein [Planctomycetaceae bacterium]
MKSISTLALTLGFLLARVSAAHSAEPLKLLFLGDSGHHRPADRFKQLEPVLKERGIELTYTDKVSDLNAETLGKYAGLVIYANTTRIEPEQEQALLDYVAGGKGLVPLHCASYCFLNSPKYIELVGAQFQRHGTGTFRTILSEEEHPITRGFGGFESWDETYVHTKHNEKDRTVLEWRQEGDRREPWTWVRTHGKGRVFYTAWGHDQRTWGNPGFQNLVERGIRWAVGDDPGVVPAFAAVGKASGLSGLSTAGETPAPPMTTKRTDVKPFEYVEANVPIYAVGGRWGTMAAPQKQMQKPLDAVESLKHLVTPVGFEPRLFVAEPDLGGKPIFMTWDERGRLWVAETYDYPNELQPKGEGRDRIRICEDTDGDGWADKFTVFAEKLSIPTAIAFYRGGALVQEGGETIYLKDTSGDDVADLKKTLVTGWSMRDTHGEVSNFRYGLDNWYYAMQGYNDSRPVLTDGRRVTGFRQGFFRFKVEGEGDNVAVTDLEFLRSTNNNTWGLGISEEGLIFGSTANGNPSEFMPIPNRYYEAVRGWSSTVLTGIADSNRYFPITDKVRQVDWHGGFTAAAGHALYTARNYPQPYWNRTAFVAEPTGHLVATFVIRPDGAGFKSKNSWNLVASDDEWTSPIQAEVGPDGNMWFIDWYNYIVQHNPTPQGFRTGKGAAYETELRDKKHGRIYRLAYVGQASSLPENTAAGWKPAPLSTPEQLVTALKSDNMFWRTHAQRLLVERGNADVIPQLIKLVSDKSVDAIGLNTAAIHALWTLHGLGALKPEHPEAYNISLAGLHHPSDGVLRNALQIVPTSEDSLRALLECGALTAKAPQVRLAAILALADKPATEATASAVIAMLEDPDIQQDRQLLDAATAAAAKNGTLALLAAAKSGNKSLANTAATERLAIVAGHVARSGLENPASLLGELKQAQPEVAVAILTGLARGWPRDSKPALSPELESTLAQLFEKLPAAGKSQLVTLATRWGSQGLGQHVAKLTEGFLAAASKEDATDQARIAAANEYADLLRNDASAGKLLDLVTPQTSPDLARGLVEALGRAEAAEVAEALAGRLPKLTPAVRTVALRVLLARNDWTTPLLDAVEQGQVQLADLSLDQKQALASHPSRRIAERARRLLAAGGGLPNADRQKVLDELKHLTEVKGDVAAGKVVFKNQCAKCHTHFGEGAKIGPDLTGTAVHPKHELLMQLIDPSRNVEGNYRVYSVLTVDGIAISGLLASETRTSIELVDSEAKRHIVQREDIANLQASSKSLMPEGFEKQVKPEEIRDLLEFLTQRGQFVPIPLDKYATAISTRGLFYDENSPQERLIFADWSPKTFEGVPFTLVDPQEDKRANVILLNGPEGKLPPTMPKSVALPCNMPAKAIHLLSGVSGWGFPYGGEKSVSMIVRLHYEGGKTEDHKLVNGEHFADYIRRVDVPGSKFAYSLRGRQIRYLAVQPQLADPIAQIELVKGDDRTAPVVMAVTVESR